MATIQSLFGSDATVLRDRDFQLLMLSTMFPILGTSLVSPVLNSVIEPFGASAASIGLMISVFTAPGIVLIPFAGVLADRYGRKPVLVGSLVLFGVAGTVIAFTTDFRVVLLLRFLQGVGFGGIVPIITASIGDMYTGGREATGQGLRLMVNGASGTVFPLIAGLLAVIAWQYPFLLYALAIPTAVAFHRSFEEPTNTNAESDGGDAKTYLSALFELVRRRRVFAMVVARTLPVVVWIGLLTYISLIVSRLMDGTAFQAGLLVAVLGSLFAVSASQAGRITGLFGSRFYPLAVANALLFVGTVGVLFSTDVVVATVWIAIVGSGFGISMALYRSILTGLAPQALRGGLVSLSAAGSRATATMTPAAMGVVISAASPAMGVGAAIQLAGIGAAVIGGVGGIVCLLVANASPAVPIEEIGPTEH